MDPQFLGEGFSEVRGEPRVSVANNFRRKSKPSVHVVHVQLGNTKACYFGCTWEEYGCPRASVIYDGEDCIFSVVFW